MNFAILQPDVDFLNRYQVINIHQIFNTLSHIFIVTYIFCLFTYLLYINIYSV